MIKSGKWEGGVRSTLRRGDKYKEIIGHIH